MFNARKDVTKTSPRALWEYTYVKRNIFCGDLRSVSFRILWLDSSSASSSGSIKIMSCYIFNHVGDKRGLSF